MDDDIKASSPFATFTAMLLETREQNWGGVNEIEQGP